MSAPKKILCLNTRQGAVFVSVFAIVLASTALSLHVLHYVLNEHITSDIAGLRHGVGCLLGSNVLEVLLALVLFVAVRQDRQKCILTWYTIFAPCTAEGIAVFVFMVYIPHENITQAFLHSLDTAVILFYVIRVIVYILLCICVGSHYKELAAGRGSREYFRKVKLQKRITEYFSRTGNLALEEVVVCMERHHPPPYVLNPPSYSQSDPPPYDTAVPIN